MPPRGFASDNYAGVQPAVMAALAAANEGHAASYGADPWTDRARELFRAAFGPQAEAFLVFNGTAANVLCLEALSAPWEGVLCAATSHLHVDECGAPERAGRKVLIAPAPHGKLTPELLDPLAIRFGDEHAIQPGVVSIAQSTELGTVYSLGEVRALADWTRERGMRLHVDGARLANAAASLGVSLRELTTDMGVDAVSFGGTKAGLLGGEAVVLLQPGAADGFAYRRKQAMQLASKMRFVAAQFTALLEEDRWRESAAHANAMAARLTAAVADVPGVEITHPVQANAVFALLPREATPRLQEAFPFYVWDEGTGEVRWMCSWDTTEEDVDAFAAAVRKVL